MKIAITGSTGLVGTALVPFLRGAGDEPFGLRRPQDWTIEAGLIRSGVLDGVEAIVHLAGENIASGRWTVKKKASIRESRVKGTKALSESLAKLDRPPGVFISMSAVGYYGNRGDVLLTEDSSVGEGFLANVCRDWEGATKPAARTGTRVIHLRTGVVLSRKGGALERMLLPFKVGIGGKLGSGNQYMSWISLDDLCSAILHCVQTTALHGPVNCTSPSPVTNAQFTKTIGRVLSRPTLAPLPAFAAHLMLGEMADELLLASARVQPAKLLASGFQFRHDNLETTMRELLAK